MPYLSIVIPAYNEENRLPATLNSVYDFCAGKDFDFEIIVVDDGSTDNTKSIVHQYANNRPQIRTIVNPINKGKGFSIKTGVLSANGELILINDADGSSPIEEFVHLQSAIKTGAQVAIGSRAKSDANRTVKALPYRTHIGNIFNRIVQSLILPGIKDTQCGFKIFTKEVARDIFSISTIDGYAFDVEILYLARYKNYRVDEVAINWHNVAGSKVNVFTDSFKMLLEVLKISWNAHHGKYFTSKTQQVNE